MSYIRIKKLEVSGPNRTTSSIEFGEKVTIIAGPSDTGKTCIYRCINYALGASNREENIPLDEQDGYDTIKLYVAIEDGVLIAANVQDKWYSLNKSSKLILYTTAIRSKDSFICLSPIDVCNLF